MKIFISLKVPRGEAELEDLANQISRVIHESGHEAFVAPHEIANHGLTDPRDFMPFIRQQAAVCDLILVIYHPELRGGLIELGIAYANQIPIWLCHKAGERVSSSARGCADLIIEYRSLVDLKKQLSTNLQTIP